MAQKLGDLWKKRLELQRFELIGGSSPKAEGNGYHNRLSFDIPYGNFRFNPNTQVQNHWLYNVYFNQIGNMMNPSYSTDRGKKFHDSIEIVSCSDEFRNTFYKYLDVNNHGYGRSISSIIGDWGSELFYYGRLAKEFVSWFDKESDIFYAFELKSLRDEFCRYNWRSITYNESYQNSAEYQTNRKVRIPKKKCLLIEWPKELGGLNAYKSVVRRVLALGEKHDVSDLIQSNPGQAVKRMKGWDLKYNKLISSWGTNHPHEDLNEYSKMINYFRLKRTIALCTHAIIDGLSQVVDFLNENLNENAKLTFENERYDVDNIESMEAKWAKGELSFKEANDFLN
jgi:hypothetical protein